MGNGCPTSPRDYEWRSVPAVKGDITMKDVLRIIS